MRKRYALQLLLLLLLLVSWPARSQIAFEPLHRDVYEFLNRASQKGLVDFDDLIKPLPKIYIAGKLQELVDRQEDLTPLERRELDFYLQDFRLETELLAGGGDDGAVMSYAGKDRAGRYRLFSYADPFFRINLSPIYGVKYGQNDGITNTHRWNGVYFYGYISDQYGFSLDFRDNREEGENIDPVKAFTPETGIIPQVFEDSDAMEYSEVRTTFSYNWSWGRITLGKDFLEWGYSESGKMVLSRKAPSFSFIRLDARLASWLKFNYFHAWLTSRVIDSTATYATLDRKPRLQDREKYLASHTFIITPARGLSVALGESIVYSDRLEIAYLQPVMFFRLADHYLANRDNSFGGNAQLFLSVNSRHHIRNTQLYGTVFIDDLSVANIFNPDKQINYFGGSFGVSLVDLPLANLTLRAEYTRINPFVYQHFIPTQTYTSSNYVLGHWMEQNADLIHGSLQYRFRRGLKAKAWGQFIRKGEKGTVEQQYRLPHPLFLFGRDTHYTRAGLDLEYEITHEFFLKGEWQYLKTSREQPDGSFGKADVSEFSIALFYGL